MQVLINAAPDIGGHEALAARFTAVVESALHLFKDRITRAEVHLSDENGHKGAPDDKRCVIEARLDGHPPLAVTHHASNWDTAVHRAADKMARLIESTTGRQSGRHSHGAARDRPEPL